jgi:formate dehydrogenase maturation protein FdhE
MSSQQQQAASTIIAAAANQLFHCPNCNQQKLGTEFNFKKADGYRYPNCQVCAHSNNVEFWRGKVFKYCNQCDCVKPLTKYHVVDGVPSYHCLKCDAADLTARRRADNAAKQTANSTAQSAWSGATNPNPNTQLPPPQGKFPKAVGSGKRF